MYAIALPQVGKTGIVLKSEQQQTIMSIIFIIIFYYNNIRGTNSALLGMHSCMYAVKATAQGLYFKYCLEHYALHTSLHPY